MKELLWRIPLTIGVTFGAISVLQKYEEKSSVTESQSARIEYADPGTQIVVGKINSALYLLKHCPDENVAMMVDRFEQLNSEAKIVYLQSGLLSRRFVSVTTSFQEPKTIAQIAVSKDHLINSDVPVNDLAVEIYETVYIFDRVKDNPKQFTVNPNFREKLEAEARESARSIIC